MGIEKRTYPRFPAALRVVLQVDGWLIEARSRDLCLGGMFVETPTVLPYGKGLTVAIDLPALPASAVIPCVVRWVTAQGLGVSFGALRAAETWAINQLAVLYTP